MNCKKTKNSIFLCVYVSSSFFWGSIWCRFSVAGHVSLGGTAVGSDWHVCDLPVSERVCPRVSGEIPPVQSSVFPQCDLSHKWCSALLLFLTFSSQLSCPANFSPPLLRLSLCPSFSHRLTFLPSTEEVCVSALKLQKKKKNATRELGNAGKNAEANSKGRNLCFSLCFCFCGSVHLFCLTVSRQCRV